MDIQAAVTQAIRTGAQTVAGIVVVFLLARGIDIDSAALETVLMGAFAGIYAAVTTLLAKHVHPIFGLLSIVPKLPEYQGGNGQLPR